MKSRDQTSVLLSVGIVSNAIFLLITVHVHCTYYEAQEDTSEGSGIDRGQNLGIQNIHTRK